MRLLSVGIAESMTKDNFLWRAAHIAKNALRGDRKVNQYPQSNYQLAE